MIYDVSTPIPEARNAIRKHFYNQAHLKDPRIRNMLVEQGYMHLESAMLQYKQKTHLMHFLEGYTIPSEGDRKHLPPDATEDEQFARA